MGNIAGERLKKFRYQLDEYAIIINNEEIIPLPHASLQKSVHHNFNRSGNHFKKRILAQGAANANIKPEEYIGYFEDLICAPNAEIGPKDFFELVSF
jgi:hypothetical protein